MGCGVGLLEEEMATLQRHVELNASLADGLSLLSLGVYIAIYSESLFMCWAYSHSVTEVLAKVAEREVPSKETGRTSLSVKHQLY